MHDEQDGGTRRFLIVAGTTRYPLRPDLDDRPELSAEVDKVRRLFISNTAEPGQDTLGYQEVPGFGLDLPASEVKQRLRTFLTAPDQLTGDDHVVFYYTGHGEVDDSGEFLLPFTDSTSDDVAGSAIPASELARWLLAGTRVRRLLVILDTCHAGAAGGEISTRAITALTALRGIASRPHVAVIAATRPREQAYAGAFTQAFTRAIRHRATGGHEPRHLALDVVLDVVNADPAKPASQHAQLFGHGEAAAEFLPNPRYNQWLRGFDLRTQLERAQRHERDRELTEHVLPRAQGLDAPQDGLWLFTGRHTVLRELSSWLRDRDRDGTVRVITGDPGSGKSSVLARLMVLATPRLLRKVPRIDELPPETLPPRESVDVFIHARGRTADQVLSALASAANVEAERPGDLLAALSDRVRPFVAVIDALDEATDPDHLAGRVLAPLVRGAPHAKLRLALGTRRHLIDRLGGPITCLNLDSAAYADPASVHAYVRRCLLDLVDDSPYEPGPVADAVAAAVAEAAGRSFLVAQITSRSLAMRAGVANPYSAVWRTGLPRLAADAMRLDLDQRLGPLATKARDLLRPLAYALGAGLPWEDFWAPLASTLAGQTYANSDLDWLVREAGFYVVEALEGTRSVYRLYHEALAEHLRADGRELDTHRAVVTFLIQRTPNGDRGRLWARAHPYVRTHLASHAAAAGRLDELVLDPTYLLNADRAPLLANLPNLKNDQARGAGRTYRRMIRQLRTKPAAEHAAYLELVARCYEAETLAQHVELQQLSRPWRTLWARWVWLGRDAVVLGHESRVRDIAIGALDERPVVVSGSDDGTARVWDLATGTAICRPFTEHHASVRTVCTGFLGGRPVAVSGSEDNTVWIWDLATGTPLLPPITGHRRIVRAAAIVDNEDRPLLVTGSLDTTVRVWDLATGEAIGKPLHRHSGGVIAVAAAKSTWRPVAASADTDGTVCVWDLVAGTAIQTWSVPLTFPILDMAVTEVEQRVVLAIACGSLGAGSFLHAWDLTTGAPVGIPVSFTGSLPRSLAAGRHAGRPILVSGHDNGAIRVWDLADGTAARAPFTSDCGNIYTLAVGMLDDLPVIVSGAENSTIRVWDLASEHQDTAPSSTHLRGIRAITSGFLDGRSVVATGGDDRVIRLWDSTTGEPVGEPFTGHTASVRAVAIGKADGQPVVVSGGDDGTVSVWNAHNGTKLPPLPLIHGAPVTAVALTTVDGRTTVVSGAVDGSVRIWDPRSGRQCADPVAGYLYPVLVVALGRSKGKQVILDGDGIALRGPSYFHRAFRPASDTYGDATPPPFFTTIDDETVIVACDRHNAVHKVALVDPKHRMLPLGPQLRSTVLEPSADKPPITALAHYPNGPLVVARGDTFEFTGHRIQLDAEITAMTQPTPDRVVVATKLGLACLELTRSAEQ